MSTAVATRGLEGIVATTSSICYIDGDAGVLSYRGIDIHELAAKSSFEETTYLLWNGALPTQAELEAFSKELAAARTLPSPVLDLLKSVPASATPMEVLRTAVSLLSIYDPDEKDSSHAANLRKSFRLTAQISMIVALFDRIRKGKAIVEADPTLSHAGNFLWMLNGEKPSETATRAFDIALILHADH
jgi:citrate synthase